MYELCTEVGGKAHHMILCRLRMELQYIVDFVEASTGIEPVYTDLQSAASPLRQLAIRGVRAD